MKKNKKSLEFAKVVVAKNISNQRTILGGAIVCTNSTTATTDTVSIQITDIVTFYPPCIY